LKRINDIISNYYNSKSTIPLKTITPTNNSSINHHSENISENKKIAVKKSTMIPKKVIKKGIKQGITIT